MRIYRAIRSLLVSICCCCASSLSVAATDGHGLGLPVSLFSGASVPAGSFPLVAGDSVAPVWCDPHDHAGVLRALRDLCTDLDRVSGQTPELHMDSFPRGTCVIVGTLGKSALLEALVASGKLEVSDLRGKWESFVITTIESPLPGVERALVIAGSDKRGTIYGIYELCEQLGVSPWYWWADVPPKKRSEAHVIPGRFCSGEPAVKYRGIFLNDEAPCLTGWAKEKFGGLNSKFYARVFELILRLRGNYLWPAMWDNAFNEDDPENPRLADEYGIVMGTSHHEPMMRAHKEWTTRRSQYGNGKWNYASNGEALSRFFREGVARNAKFENLVTIGMRGDGDEGMVSSGDVRADIALLERIFTDQRRILSEELRRPPEAVPQLWALFTEVQKFYELGLRPPEDVTLLWTDDNVGNLRRLPTSEERTRRGGAGVYFHLDMHGGPFAYQWINTSAFVKIAEQMTLASEYGATRIWIANVGDLKPLELPIEFFLRMAWNPSAFTKDRIADYARRWAARDFGPEHAEEIADIVSSYMKFNGWRKPELITPDTFSHLHYDEAARVSKAWQSLLDRAERLNLVLPSLQRDAFFQLVLHPVKASAIVCEMNIAAGRNRLYAMQGRASTNCQADKVRDLFRADRALTHRYNHELSGGKWNHLMDQSHLGQYTWEPPVVDVMPAVSEVILREEARLGVSVEGDPSTWPDHFGEASLPVFESFRPCSSWIDVFPVGTLPVAHTISSEQPWIQISPCPSSSASDTRYRVEIAWALAPEGQTSGEIFVKGAGTTVRIRVPVIKAGASEREAARGCFVSLHGPLAFAASSAVERHGLAGARWEDIPDYGRGQAGVGIYPVTAPSILPPEKAPTLVYPLYLPRAGSYEVTLVVGPVMDFVPDRGMRLAVSFDDAAPRVVDLFANREAETFLGAGWWHRYTRDNARLVRSTHVLATPGRHSLRVAMVDPGVVLQKIIISDRPLPPSYFGPVEGLPLKH